MWRITKVYDRTHPRDARKLEIGDRQLVWEGRSIVVEVLDSIDHWWIKYIRFQRLSNRQYFCFTDSADTIIPLYKDKLKAEFVNQDEKS